MKQEVYIATIATYYKVFAVGETEADAKKAACRYYRTDNPVYDVWTDKQVEDYFGINVYGPCPVPGAVGE